MSLESPDLSVELGSLRLANPVLVASGTFGYGTEREELTSASGLGGIVTKTITLEPRSGNAPPRLFETPSGLLNSIGLQNVGIDRFLAEKLPPLRELGVPIVVSIGGRSAEDFTEVARRLDGAGGVSALELNVSCPNVKEGGLEFCQVPGAAARVVERVRAVTPLPLWTKLSPNLTRIGELAHACEDAGSDALTAVNTFVGLAVDIRTGRSRLSPGTGGLSGPAIRPLALAKVREVVRAVRIPVIGVGGIASAEDVLEFLVVGARAVQIGTANFADPSIGARVVADLAGFLRAQKLGSIREITNTYRDDKPAIGSPAAAKESP